MTNPSLLAYPKTDQGFYPTPPEMAAALLSTIKWSITKTVLEPSAGKGDLVHAITRTLSTNGYKDVDVDCVEIDAHFRSIIKDEFTHNTHVRIVGDDFLTFSTHKKYDAIIMNPPFAQGALHLLKAITMQQEAGGVIRCLLNAETILNPCSSHRLLLKAQLDKYDASVQFLDHAFADAERQSDVRVAMISIDIPAPVRKSTIFERMHVATEAENQEETPLTGLAPSDCVQNIIAAFNAECNTGLELIREYLALRPYLGDSFMSQRCSNTLCPDFCDGECAKKLLPAQCPNFKSAAYVSRPTITLIIGDPYHAPGLDKPDANRFLELVRLKYWKELFNKPEIVNNLTASLRDKYRGMVEELAHYDFSEFNIRKTLTAMNAEMMDNMSDTICALFTKLSSDHAWYPETGANIHYFNGWKTTKAHKVNRKVIVPVNGLFATYSWSKTFEEGKATDLIGDIEKTLNFLDGHRTDPVDLSDVLSKANENGQTKNIHCKYFDVSIYKKGTMHITFTNLDLLDRFNIYVGRKKNWLPPFYGEKQYPDMDKEEQRVVDEFQGQEAYAKVLANLQYFLSPPSLDEDVANSAVFRLQS